MPPAVEDPSSVCPTDQTVALFIAGDLDAAGELAFREHVDSCSECRGLLAEAGRAVSDKLRETIIAPLEAKRITPLARGDLIANKYRVDGILGSGGMGTVFRAWHLGLNRAVAIKMVHPALLSGDLARRFAKEARAAASITSEHAVRILDIDHLPSGAPYIVMEHLDGKDLHELLMVTGPLEWRRAVAYLLEACDAIGEAHARGIVHRDLKPHNLFLTTNDVIKVLDFGLAKTLPHSLVQGSTADGDADADADARSTGLVGSPQYMAPEQIRAAKTVDVRTDIYALGATLYQLLTGVPPFLGLNLYVLCARILENAPVPVTKIRKDIPPPIEAVTLRCLEKEPEARYASVADLCEALRATLREPDLLAAGDHGAAPLTLDATLAQTLDVPLAQTLDVPLAQTFDVPLAQTRVDPRAPPTDPSPTLRMTDETLPTEAEHDIAAKTVRTRVPRS